LDPIDDMGIKDEGLKSIVRVLYNVLKALSWISTLKLTFFPLQKIEALEHKMYTHPMQKDPERDSLFELCEKKFKVSFKCSLLNLSVLMLLLHLY
jgi:ATP-dependent RNA helicase DOB1